MSESVETLKRVVVEGRWKGNVIPGRIDELGREVFVEEGAEVTGCVYGFSVRLEGPCSVFKAVYASQELVVSPRNGDVVAHSSLGSKELVYVENPSHRLVVEGDVNARNVNLRNAVVRGSVLGDEVRLVDCVILGVVRSQGIAELTRTTASTFDAQDLCFHAGCGLLLPYARAEQRLEMAEPVILWAAGSEEHTLGYEDIVVRDGCKVLSGGRRLTDYAKTRRFVENLSGFLFSITMAESIRDARELGGYEPGLLPDHLVRMLPEIGP